MITYEVHPSIGVARVGNSDDFFTAPEPGATPPATYRDARGALKRQAVRFRVYRCERDDRGRLLESTAVVPSDKISVEWDVHLANRKGAAPRFGKDADGNRREGRRNPNADLADLVIDGGRRELVQLGDEARFDSGRFMGVPVALGEAAVEENGVLRVVGGRGSSGYVPTADGASVPLREFANNDRWYDDTSDGPVRATVVVDGKAHRAKPGWVVVGQPNFAPEIKNFITLYDVAYQAAVDRGWIAVPATSWPDHIEPLVDRTIAYQWVVASVMRSMDSGTRHKHLLNKSLLGDPSSAEGSVYRSNFFKHFRDPAGNVATPAGMPRLHDHEFSGNVLPLTRVQYEHFRNWARDEFIASAPEVQVHESELLDRISLEACVGGPLHPGMEVGSVAADPAAYSEPFRFDADRFSPGDITAQNAVPWQADFSECRWEGDKGWWPAQRPDKVLVLPDQPDGNVVRPELMQLWDRGAGSREAMVALWHKLGFVVRQVVRLPSGDIEVFAEKERTL